MPLTTTEIIRLRLTGQQIAYTPAASPGAVVAALGALQAQDYTGALWAIGLRLAHATQADVERAIADRHIVRTWPLRGTLHFVAAADVRWMLELLAPRQLVRSANRRRQLALDEAELALSHDLAVAALQGGRQLARHELLAAFEAGGISTAGQRGYHLLVHLALRRVLCFGPRRDKSETFVLLDEWVPDAPRKARDEALAELAARYFTGHGPATLQDFVWWSGLNVADARAGIAAARAQLAQVEADGEAYWLSPRLTPASISSPVVHLLPGFDEYLLGYRKRDAVLEPQQAQKIVPGANGVFRPILLLDGRVVGTWQRTFIKDAVRIEAEPFVPLEPQAQQAFAVAAAQVGRFWGREVEVT